jgi:Protein of unknown function (DUF2948)
MPELKLIAFDADDLAVISAHMQDALLRVGDLAWLPGERRFAAVGNRFDWVEAMKEGTSNPSTTYLRRQVGLRFERVGGAQLLGIDVQRREAVLSLLTISFEPSEPPAGHIILRFAEGGAIRLQVECIEAELKDLGPVWRAASMPKHDEGDLIAREE